jgi:hypothetical protein
MTDRAAQAARAAFFKALAEQGRRDTDGEFVFCRVDFDGDSAIASMSAVASTAGLVAAAVEILHRAVRSMEAHASGLCAEHRQMLEIARAAERLLTTGATDAGATDAIGETRGSA